MELQYYVTIKLIDVDTLKEYESVVDEGVMIAGDEKTAFHVLKHQFLSDEYC